MLWAKESNHPDALYVDVFRLFRDEELYIEPYRQYQCSKPVATKDDDEAVKKRKEGNEMFRLKNWIEANMLYCRSLCLATNGSENISLAYANRSACFYNMGKYNKCLIDIKLAREAGYPQHLMPKLNKREADCLKYIAEGAIQDEPQLMLSFDPNENYPNLANVLTFDRNENGEASLVATEDIDVGQIIAIQKPFSILHNFMYFCKICMATATNLVPCTKCTDALFCHGSCQHNDLHQFECGLRFCDNNGEANIIVMTVVRTILMAINMFPTVDDLMDFVEVEISRKIFEIPENLSDPRSQYRAFLKFPLKKSIDTGIAFGVFGIYNTLLNVPKINAIFQTRQHQRFLMHLIGFHWKAYMIHSSKINRGSMEMFTATTLFSLYIKRSCTPNVGTHLVDNEFVVITIRPIKRGEQLTWTSFNHLLDSKETRQKNYDACDYECQCARCEGVFPSPEQKKRLDLDPLYRCILLNYGADESNEQIRKVTEKCEEFLRKYAEFPWCDEIGRVISIYIKSQKYRFGATEYCPVENWKR